jgi:crossover junction endodeoxyribonuclease RusA
VSEIAFFVPGRPQTAGSKSAITKGKGGVPLAKPVIVDSGNRPDKRAWRSDLRDTAAAALRGLGTEWRTDLAMDVLFVIVRKRPAGHLRSGRNAGLLHEWARAERPVTRPDALKIARAAEDALTHVLWDDDSAIVSERLEKVYADQVGLGVKAEGLFVRVRVAGAYDGPAMASTLAVPEPPEFEQLAVGG